MNEDKDIKIKNLEDKYNYLKRIISSNDDNGYFKIPKEKLKKEN